MSRITGRSDDMLIIRGVNVFPSQVESVILELEEFEPHYMLIVDRKNNLDTLEVQVEVLFGRDQQNDGAEKENRTPTAKCSRYCCQYKIGRTS